MKRLYIGAALLAVMLAAGICLTAIFNSIHEPLSAQLQEAQAAAVAGDWEKAADLTARSREKWEKYRHFTAAVADHEPLEEMDSLFARLEVLCQLREEDEFAADCAQLARLADAMAESQRINWWNLL